MRTLLLLLTLAFTLPLLAGDDGNRYRVLLPVYTDQPLAGAFGSRWDTTLAMRNPNAQDVQIDWCSFRTEPEFVCPAIGIPAARLDAGETQVGLNFDFSPGPKEAEAGPRLLYLRAPSGGDPARVEFALRAFDVSRSNTNAGTEIPVVREEQFRTTTLQLLNVPVDPAFRLALRLYETNLKIAGFTVRVFDQRTNALLGQRDVVLAYRYEPQWQSMFEPPNAQIDDLTMMVSSGTALPPALRIEVQPRSAGSEFWAFVSITNNETQHLTLVTPR